MATQDKGIDFIAYDPKGQIILVGEVKSRAGTSEKWATGFRRNMLAHGTVPDAPFFLIVTPERLYFWKQDQSEHNDSPPEFTFDTRKEFKHYFADSDKTPGIVGEQALEFLVLSWLKEIARRSPERVTNEPSMRWLADSGLLKSLEEAHFESNLA